MAIWIKSVFLKKKSATGSTEYLVLSSGNGWQTCTVHWYSKLKCQKTSLPSAHLLGAYQRLVLNRIDRILKVVVNGRGW